MNLSPLEDELGAQLDQLFDLAYANRRDARRASEGFARAISIAVSSLPTGATTGLAGGLGYCNGHVAGSASVCYRIGPMSRLFAGVGIAPRSGTVGARAGFQIAWSAPIERPAVFL